MEPKLKRYRVREAHYYAGDLFVVDNGYGDLSLEWEAFEGGRATIDLSEGDPERLIEALQQALRGEPSDV